MTNGDPLPLRRVGPVLLAVSVGLVVLDQVLFHVGLTGSYGELLYSYIDVTRESNVPAFWNAALLLLVSAAAVLVAYLTPGPAVGWWIAAALAFVMSLDETVQLHERLIGLGRWVQDAVGTSIPTFGWLIPGVLIAIAGATTLWIWSARRPPATRRALRVAVVVYGSGAIVVEAVGGAVYRSWGAGAGYRAITGLEELLEMSGAALAVVAVLAMMRVRHSSDHATALSIVADDERPRSAANAGTPSPEPTMNTAG